jgi:hypothetical protein
MSLSDKINLLVSRYVRRQIPRLEADNLGPYLQEELRELEASIRSLADASIQVADREPEGVRKGMVRYAVSPWNPLGNGTTGLVVYNGTAWVAV